MLAYPSSVTAEEGEVAYEPSQTSSFTFATYKGYVKDFLAPRFHISQNFFGVNYKNFILGDTMRYTDEDFRVAVSEIHDNFNAWGIFYVSLRDFLRTRFAINFYEYVKLDYTYSPDDGKTNNIDQIKLTEGDFSVAYTVFLNRSFPIYAGAGLTAGHMRIQSGTQSREKPFGYVGAKLVLGGSYIFEETLLIDACYHSIPFGLNQGYATTISTGFVF